MRQQEALADGILVAANSKQLAVIVGIKETHHYLQDLFIVKFGMPLEDNTLSYKISIVEKTEAGLLPMLFPRSDTHLWLLLCISTLSKSSNACCIRISLQFLKHIISPSPQPWQPRKILRTTDGWSCWLIG